MRLLRTFILVVAALLMATSAYAGHYKLIYETTGSVSLASRDVVFADQTKGTELIFQILPRTGDYSPGPAIALLDGKPVWQTDGSSYWGSVMIPDCGDIKVLDGTKLELGRKQPKAADINVDSRWFLVKHQIEVYFAATDGRGRVDKNRSFAPATQFELQPTTLDTFATTTAGQAMTASQFNAAVEAAFRKGAESAEGNGQGDRQKMEDQIKQLLAENNKLREAQALAGKNSIDSPSPSLEVYGYAFTPTGDLKNDNLTREQYAMLTEKALRGGIIDVSKPIKVRDGQHYLLFVRSANRFDFVVNNGYENSRKTGYKVGKFFRFGYVLRFYEGIGNMTVNLNDGTVLSFTSVGGRS